MKVSNRNLVVILEACNEIANSKELKADLKDAFKVIYAVHKTKNSIQKQFDELVVKEKALTDAYNNSIISATADKAKMDANNQFVKDNKELFDAEVEVELYQFNEEEVPAMVKHLTGNSTFAVMDFLSNGFLI